MPRPPSPPAKAGDQSEIGKQLTWHAADVAAVSFIELLLVMIHIHLG